jgi:threonylcarbamoyladenosine tRNA methylthiotransferase MtaB
VKIHLDSVGCRLNQSEIESYARQFRAAGHVLVPTLQEADMMVLNSCAVTQSAVSDSRQKVRKANRAGVKEIIVTGCWSDIEEQEVRALLGVSEVIRNRNKDVLVANTLNIAIEEFDLEPIAREAIPGGRMRTRAYIKAQDGCDNHCTFCVTTIARGPSRSRSIEQIMKDVHSALQGGSKEIVLTGVHLGSWGYDLEGRSKLKDLIRELLMNNELPRLRISSLEPWDLDEAFFELWEDPRLCRHLHLPLQSGSAGTLRRMARNTTPEKFSQLISAARKTIPDVAITTDVIVGFPGESESEFEESLSFVKQQEFADGHIFTYSERKGTAAANMEDAVQNGIRKERNQIMREAVGDSEANYIKRFLGSHLDVLWESESNLDDDTVLAVGLTDNYLRVETLSPKSLWNQIQRITLTSITGKGMRGKLDQVPENVWFD